MLLDSMAATLQLIVAYGAPEGGEDTWVQGWNTHEDAATLVAYVFWWLMVLAHKDGLDKHQAIEYAIGFSYDACGMDLFEDDLTELSGMYNGTSYWTGQFGPTK